MNICSIIGCVSFVSAKNLCLKHYKHSHYLKNKGKNLKAAKKWRKNNPEKRKKIAREWARKNKEKLKIYYQNNKDKWKLYKQKRRKKFNDWYKNKRKTDLLFNIACNLRKRLNECLYRKKFTKKGHFKDILGCSLEEFKIHLENQFQKDMTWENYGKWHIDHIIPCCSANTTEELNQLNHFTNLRPLWAKDNLMKIQSDMKYRNNK